MSHNNVFLEDCPARTTLELIADTWSVVVIAALGQGHTRFSDLREAIGGISKKMLAQTLRKLERNGIVDRDASATYRLTALGESLLQPVRVLADWAEANADEIVLAQDRQLAAVTAR
jgi:DNA-binding HxlR family transcriptional regulator